MGKRLKKNKQPPRKFIRAADAVDGSDYTIDDFAEGLRAFADMVEWNDEISLGNIEWFERQAAAMRWSFEYKYKGA